MMEIGPLVWCHIKNSKKQIVYRQKDSTKTWFNKLRSSNHWKEVILLWLLTQNCTQTIQLIDSHFLSLKLPIANYIGYLDTNLPDTEIMVQILRPTDLVTLTKKFLKWQGDDNSYWQPHMRRSAVKLIVELTPRGRKLAAHSLQDISNMFPDLK